MSKCNSCYHNKICIDGANYKTAENCRHYIPAADVQEVRHGHWKQRMSTLTSVKCSECGTCHEYDTRYCPYCGCRMDGDV